MSELTVNPASQADPDSLDRFLRRFFGDAKAEFLRRHGDWWHRGEENRWVLLDVDTIAGYCGVIPTVCLVAGQAHDAVWWMDLVIAPQYRGRGLQTRFDDLVRDRGSLLLGFPNELAAKIHRHHGWGVREDLRTVLLPLDPPRIGAVRRAQGLRGKALRLAAAALRPAAAFWRRRLEGYRPRGARRLVEPDFDQLASLAAEHLDRRCVTTRRDAAHLRWRYGKSPHEHLVYAVGEADAPRIVLVARRVDESRERWLDLFGDLEDRGRLSALVRFAAGEASRAGIAQVTALTSSSPIHRAMRRAGFLLGSTARFCWLADDRETMGAIAAAPHHWVLGDSDNDEPAMGEAKEQPSPSGRFEP